jgi:hypothetical protein
MSDLNVGVVGLGWVAGAHIDTFRAVNGANVTAICSRREQIAGTFAPFTALNVSICAPATHPSPTTPTFKSLITFLFFRFKF